MRRRWHAAGGVLAAVALILARPDTARAAHWVAYFPGGIVDWYVGGYPFLRSWPNVHWPSRDSYMTYGIGRGTYKVYYPTPDASGKYYYYTPKAGVPYQETTALVEVKLPISDADVWFDGSRTASTGPVRQFLTPPLVVGRDYRYEVRALWNEGGHDVLQTRTVTVRAGDRLSVDFTTEEKSGKSGGGGR
jgi:uncharacterized protein (TIGR03000 family)